MRFSCVSYKNRLRVSYYVSGVFDFRSLFYEITLPKSSRAILSWFDPGRLPPSRSLCHELDHFSALSSAVSEQFPVHSCRLIESTDWKIGFDDFFRFLTKQFHEFFKFKTWRLSHRPRSSCPSFCPIIKTKTLSPFYAIFLKIEFILTPAQCFDAKRLFTSLSKRVVDR